MVHTGAASQLGQMLCKYCATQATDLTLLNVVRREEQAETLRACGAKHVIVTAGDPAVWRAQLKEKIKALKLTLAFDCVAGEMSEILLDALPKGGTTFVYGRLSGEPARAGTLDLIYFGKTLEGFLVAGQGKQTWLNMAKPISALAKLRGAGKAVCAGLGPGGWCESKFVDCSLDDMKERFLATWESGFTNKKLRIRFDEPGLREERA
jgi:NADPH:quinone reductase-like Zn-dependent oxidoreductase